MNAARFHETYVVNAAGERVSVILPLGEFQALLEDLDDLAAIAERRDEEAVDHAQVVAELKRDGLL